MDNLTSAQIRVIKEIREEGYVTSNTTPSRTITALRYKNLIKVVDRYASGHIKCVLTIEGRKAARNLAV